MVVLCGGGREEKRTNPPLSIYNTKKALLDHSTQYRGRPERNKAGYCTRTRRHGYRTGSQTANMGSSNDSAIYGEASRKSCRYTRRYPFLGPEARVASWSGLECGRGGLWGVGVLEGVVLSWRW